MSEEQMMGGLVGRAPTHTELVERLEADEAENMVRCSREPLGEGDPSMVLHSENRLRAILIAHFQVVAATIKALQGEVERLIKDNKWAGRKMTEDQATIAKLEAERNEAYAGRERNARAKYESEAVLEAIIAKLREALERRERGLRKIIERHEFGGEHLQIARAALKDD